MVNTSLPETVTGGSSGHLGHTGIVHAEINAMSRDTGWRYPALSNGWGTLSAGMVRCRRENNLVIWQFIYLSGANATSGQILTLSGNPPAGSSSVSRGLCPRYNSRHWFTTPGGAPFNIYFTQTGVYVSGIPSASVNDQVVYEIVAHADQGWPANLPPEA